MLPTDIIICDWHDELRDGYPSIPLFPKKGFRVLPGGWRNVEATERLIEYAQHYRRERMLGPLCTVWGAALPGALANFPPIRAALAKLA
jgi:hypothetical protein